MIYRSALIACGFASLVIGAIGLFVPLLPTTPFLLLAAACFARGSQRLHQRLLASRYFGPILTDWERHRAIALRTKILATVLSCGALAYPLAALGFPLALKVSAAATMMCVLVFVWTRASSRR